MSWGSCAWASSWGEDCGPTSLLTSGSWTYEAIYKFPQNRELSSITQSLARLCTTGGEISGGLATVVNCLVVSGTDVLHLWARPTHNTGSDGETLHMILSGVDVFDGDKWHVTFGRFRNDDPADYLGHLSGSPSIKSNVSASWFLRAARPSLGELTQDTYHTASYYLEATDLSDNALQTTENAVNGNGATICVGSQSLTINDTFSLMTQSVPIDARTTYFDGKIAQMRFWSRGILLDEWKEHVRNYRSAGVERPSTGYNFNEQLSSSFGRLRIDASMDQHVTQSNADGTITLTDFSQNGLHVTGSGFESSANILKAERFEYSILSPKFAETVTNNKIRIHSFNDFDNVQQYGGAIAPVYEVANTRALQNDPRVTIDFSVVDALNEDIITIFSTLDELEQEIGRTELLFSSDYQGLRNLRGIYFNRLTDKVNLKGFFEFFRWFDDSVGMFIEQLMPNNAHFLGTNFVVESHMLERPKYEYKFEDVYLGENNRHPSKQTFLTRLIEGRVTRY